jgi:ABC-type uncharacterized transport system involved in gliding motility auxiliary subunit
MPAVQRISIIQVRGGHDECVTPLVYTLNQIGVQCDVYINHGLLVSRGNIFEALHIKADEFIVTGKFRLMIYRQNQLAIESFGWTATAKSKDNSPEEHQEDIAYNFLDNFQRTNSTI